MAKIQIDEGDLLMAFESGDGMTQWFLDRETGAVIGLGDDILLDDEDDEDDQDWEREEKARRRAIYADVDGEGVRYLGIESLSSHEGFRIMEDFAASQVDRRVREALFDALDRRRPFRSFKDALEGFRGVSEAWYSYHEARLREEALAWLRSEGIDAELTSPVPPPAAENP
ncbi:MAG TPA: UPF0158 family protein [Longimicrobium sp.]|jgi:hypothetical protein|nr:UPF0158 family protein [Longimicrobium sp.]